MKRSSAGSATGLSRRPGPLCRWQPTAPSPTSAVGLTAVGLDGTVAGIGDLLSGRLPGEDLFAEAGRIAAAACEPVADQRGGVDYKRHLADELTRRVLRRACARASEEQEG